MSSERDKASENDESVNMRNLVARIGPLPLKDAIDYTLQIAEYLASQHDVVHRDIKPSSILVMSDGQAKFFDTGATRQHFPSDGVTLETFDYISPELARDPRENGVRSDLYSLGCTFHYMLTGAPPFPDGTVLQKLLRHSSESPPDVRDLRADLPKEVSAIAMKLMAKLPSQRYQTPKALIDDLVILTERSGQCLNCPVSNEHDKAKRWRPRFSIRTLVIVVTLVCLYAACWGPTKKWGVEDTFNHVENSLDLSPDRGFFASGGLYRSFDSPVVVAPLIVSVQHYTNGSVTGRPRFDDPKPVCKEYYFWFFGYVAKLPYERELPPTVDID